MGLGAAAISQAGEKISHLDAFAGHSWYPCRTRVSLIPLQFKEISVGVKKKVTNWPDKTDVSMRPPLIISLGTFSKIDIVLQDWLPWPKYRELRQLFLTCLTILGRTHAHSWDPTLRHLLLNSAIVNVITLASLSMPSEMAMSFEGSSTWMKAWFFEFWMIPNGENSLTDSFQTNQAR